MDFIQSVLGVWSIAENKIEFLAGIFTTITTVLQTFFFSTLSYFTNLAVIEKSLSIRLTAFTIDIFRYDLYFK